MSGRPAARPAAGAPRRGNGAEHRDSEAQRGAERQTAGDDKARVETPKTRAAALVPAAWAGFCVWGGYTNRVHALLSSRRDFAAVRFSRAFL